MTMFHIDNKQNKVSNRGVAKSASRAGFLCLALSLALLSVPSVAYGSTENDPNLAKLEVKFFQHDFAKEDDVNARLDRLEKMVFGDARTGDPDERLKNLLVAVPNLDAKPAAPAKTQTASDDSAQPAPRAPQKPVKRTPSADELAEQEKDIQGVSQYPAVSAMEQRVLGRDYASEPIVKRLERLELKTFGKVSASDDLSDRVDRLKDRTGVDLAKTPPPGSDWADDEDAPMGGGSVTYHPPASDGYTRGSGTYGGGGSGGSSSSMGGYSAGGSGSYGMGAPASRPAGGYQAGGGYGYGAPRKVASAGNPVGAGYPRPAPDYTRELEKAPSPALGLSDTIGLLENELFGKNFRGETIPIRLNRLEATVFPSQKAASDMAMPDRVRRLTEAVPISNDAGGKRIAQRGNNGRNPNADLSQADEQDLDPMPRSAPPVAPQRGGFSKILSGLGSLIGAGGYNSYAVGSNLVPDPQGSGYLLDRYSGNLIDPSTGAVIGRSGSMGMGGMGMGMSATPLYGGGFNSGLSPIGSPYGMMGGSNMRLGGFGGSGIRFGGSSMMGGMGTGMGLWP